MVLIDQLKKYEPYNDQEKSDQITLLNHLEGVPNIFLRENQTAHMTASAWVVNKDRTKLLMVHHNLYNSWSWLGGHADGDQDLLAVAIKEVKEESGVEHVSPLTDGIFSIEILTVDGHNRRGIYVPSHLHFNITYLLEADDTHQLHIKHDENSDVAWFDIDQAVGMSSEPWFQERIYSKLNEKLEIYLRQSMI